MVHALYEAHRALKPNGILIDLRPAARHRRVGLGEGEQWQPVGVMRERLDEDRAANRAVRQVVREGLLRPETLVEFELDRVMDSPEEFQMWLDEFIQESASPPHEWLMKRLERARQKEHGEQKIVVRGPLVLRAMSKPTFHDQH